MFLLGLILVFEGVLIGMVGFFGGLGSQPKGGCILMLAGIIVVVIGGLILGFLT